MMFSWQKLKTSDTKDIGKTKLLNTKDEQFLGKIIKEGDR